MATQDSSLQSDVSLPIHPSGRGGGKSPLKKGPPPLPPGKKKAKPAGPAKTSRSAQPAAGGRSLKREQQKRESAANRVKQKAAEAQVEQEAERDEEEGVEEEAARTGVAAWLSNSAALTFSTIAHMAVLLLLGLWMLPGAEKEFSTVLTVNPTSDEPMEEELTTELESPLEENSLVMTSAPSAVSNGMAAAQSSMSNAPSLDQSLAEQVQGVDIQFDGPPIKVPGPTSLVSALPKGQIGEARAIVDNYDQALDRITQEILMMLAESPVLVVWCFDESESMKDDQAEIRDRVDYVYTELGLKNAAQGDALLTSICSYGDKFTIRTAQPTSKLIDIKDAIDSISIDTSGLEHMCSAVGQAITAHASFAKPGRRQMALILVSDESGEQDDNNKYVEPMVQAALAAKCRVYTLGREAVFGYPYAHISWRHPQTGHVHWLPINRGPETGFVEQLQTEGFRRRYDAHSSGFGPYEQVRLAQQTGGIFFMLPSVEAKLVRGKDKRRYELEAMRAYQPDIRARAELWKDANASRFRTTILKIINDLNPYRPEIAKAMEVRFEFSAKPETFFKQVEQEQTKAKQYVLYLDAAAKALDELQPLRQQEYSHRWQANYDVIYAQVLAYTARTYEYGAYLEKFKLNPKKVPYELPKKRRLAEWHIRETKKIVAPDVSQSYIARASEMFQQVIQEHPGTPWAARAQWELNRGFGVELREVYHYYGPRPPGRPRPKRIPIPKM